MAIQQQIPNPQRPLDWTSQIKQYVSRKLPKEALLFYTKIRRNGLYHLCALPLLLKACASLNLLNCGKSLHAETIKYGSEINVMVGTSLLDMYAKCGEVSCSRRVFDEMHERNVVTWNAMVGGYMKNGDVERGLELFGKMEERTRATWIEMIGGFSRNGDMERARRMFDTVPGEVKDLMVWTVMVEGYASNGEMEAARELFEAMPERNWFVWSSMICGYFKKCDVKEARAMFDRMEDRNLVNWNSLISGYAQNGCCEEALEAFERMQTEGFEPDEVSFVSCLSASAQLGLLDAGRKLHNLIIFKGIKLTHFVGNALVDMYAKCGDLNQARRIFEGMTERNRFCWNGMISGLASHGHGEEALKYFRKMEESNENPDEVTFLSVLSACAHGGFIDEAMEIFFKMEKYGVLASMKHYGCLVDLLGRAGRLLEALDLIKKMPVEPNDEVWRALLGACRIHMDLKAAERVIEEIRARHTSCRIGESSQYVLLSSIFAVSNDWEKAEKMRLIMRNKKIKKIPGHSSIISQTQEAPLSCQL